MTENGAALIAAERQRQINEEGYLPHHDLFHDDLSLMKAADEYLSVAEYVAKYGHPITCEDWLNIEDDHGFQASRWPWAAEHFKPAPEPIRNLVKAGALIAAEIDRLQRAALNTESEVAP